MTDIRYPYDNKHKHFAAILFMQMKESFLLSLLSLSAIAGGMIGWLVTEPTDATPQNYEKKTEILNV